MQNVLKTPSVEDKILERLERLTGKVDTVQLMYYNPKAKDKSGTEPKLPFDPKLIDGQKFMKKLDGESERYHRLFLYYLEHRSFDLVMNATMGMGKRLNKRQIFNIARQYKWKERTAKYESEINCEVMEYLHSEYLIEKKNKFRNLINIMNQTNFMIKSLDEYCSIDFESLRKDKSLSDADRLKHIKLFVGIYKDYIAIVEKCEKQFREFGVADYDPFSVFNDFDKEFGEEEFDDPFAELEEKERLIEMEEEEEEKIENNMQFDAIIENENQSHESVKSRHCLDSEDLQFENETIEITNPNQQKSDVACNVSTKENIEKTIYIDHEKIENLVQNSVIFKHKKPAPPRPKAGTLEEMLYKFQNDELDFEDVIENQENDFESEEEISENDDEYD